MRKISGVIDPRQKTYSTTYSGKNKQYESIFDYVQEEMPYSEIDSSSLNISYRCHEPALDLANRLYAQYEPLKSGAVDHSGHDDVYLVEESEVHKYIERYNPSLLRYSAKRKYLMDIHL